MNKLYKVSIFLSFLLISLFSELLAYLDGMRNLYPNGKYLVFNNQGNRPTVSDAFIGTPCDCKSIQYLFLNLSTV